MTQLIAKSPLFYGGRTRRIGEIFAAPPRDAEILLITGKAAKHEVDEPVKVRRQYKRRDLRAEV